MRIGDEVISYAHVVIWIWTVALVATLAALAGAWRAIARADAAVASLRVASDGMATVGQDSAALAHELTASSAGRAQVVQRASGGRD